MYDIEYRQVFSEVDEIIKILPDSLKNKIPTSFIDMVRKNRDINYNPEINSNLREKRLKTKTEVILGIIYRDFLCSRQEKEDLLKKEKEELIEIYNKEEQEARKKYKVEDIFKSRKERNLNMEKNGELEILMQLKKAQWDLRESLQEDLTDKQNYQVAKKKYEKYALIYKQITKQEPKKSFEELMKIVNNSKNTNNY